MPKEDFCSYVSRDFESRTEISEQRSTSMRTTIKPLSNTTGSAVAMRRRLWDVGVHMEEHVPFGIPSFSPNGG